jgi:hypothetical protein
VSFEIGRIDDPEDPDGALRTSEELVEQADDSTEVVLALDGATLDEATVEAIAEAAATPDGSG